MLLNNTFWVICPQVIPLLCEHHRMYLHKLKTTTTLLDDTILGNLFHTCGLLLTQVSLDSAWLLLKWPYDFTKGYILLFVEVTIINDYIIHCYLPFLGFPKKITMKQCYRLLGNSLNVHVVAKLIKILCE